MKADEIIFYELNFIKMKKVIIRIAATALLVGGLAFNFVLSSNNGAEQNFDLNAITNSSVAQAEYCFGCPGSVANYKLVLRAPDYSCTYCIPYSGWTCHPLNQSC